jgi:hypothetical protein
VSSRCAPCDPNFRARNRDEIVVELREAREPAKKKRRRRKKEDDDPLFWLFLAFALPRILKLNKPEGPKGKEPSTSTGTVKVPTTTGTSHVPDVETPPTIKQPQPAPGPFGIPQPPTIDVPPIEVPIPVIP